mmetsp:Transcript_109284/g.170923  ORF Transcript_109284/g.170923 Transcript_109284/m.170923 type:complete len:572 (+) Transcript_109284:74-1789(+)
MDEALFTDAVAEDCLPERSQASALSLMQRSARLRQGRKKSMEQVLPNDAEHQQFSFLQLESETGYSSDVAGEAESQSSQTSDGPEIADSPSHEAQSHPVQISDGPDVPESAAGEEQNQPAQTSDGPEIADLAGSNSMAPPDFMSSFAEDIDLQPGAPSQEDITNVEAPSVEGRHTNPVSDAETSDSNGDKAPAVRESVVGADPSDESPRQGSTISKRISNSDYSFDFGASLANLPIYRYMSKFNSVRSVLLLCSGAFTITYFLWLLLCARTGKSGRLTQSHRAERAQVTSLSVCRARSIEELLPSSVGYDCRFSKPCSSRQPVRLEGRIERLEDGCTLVSPLRQQQCVKFSSVAYCQEKDGMRPHPIALYSASVPFVVALADAPHVKVSVQGEEVRTFDLQAGYHSSKHTFASADQHWKDFVLDCHVGASQPMHSLQSSEEMLEFRESAILLGSLVTLFGELHRDSAGRLHLQPWAPHSEAIPELGRTSSDHDDGKENSCPFGKVLVSDDPALHTCASLRFLWGWILNILMVLASCKRAGKCETNHDEDLFTTNAFCGENPSVTSSSHLST